MTATATEPTMPTEQSAFLRAILADPADDTARLVYADWLQENAGWKTCPRCDGRRGRTAKVNGGYDDEWIDCHACGGIGRVSDGASRAEFIRVQCELARTPELEWANKLIHRADWEAMRPAERGSMRFEPSRPHDRVGVLHYQTTSRRWEALRRRERELQEANAPKWFALPGLACASVWDHSPTIRWCEADDPLELNIIEGDSARGFLDSVTCTAADWLRHADSLVWHPGQTVECPECGGERRVRQHYDPSSGEMRGGVRCPTCSGEGRVSRRIPATAQPITRVVLTDGGEFGISVWLGDHNAYVTRWIDPADHRKGFTDDRWPGITFESSNLPANP